MKDKDELLLSHIRVPREPVPVMAVIDGERVQVGTGTLDKKTGIFTTTFDDSESSQRLWKHLRDNGHYSLPVEYSEVQAIEGLEL
jgi:hypothetical protein